MFNRKYVVAALALAAAAAPATAQLDAPSKTNGFSVGLHLVGNSFDTDADDDFDEFTGGGLGLELAYGFNSGLALFLDVSGNGLESDDADEDATDGAVHVDLGARYNFGGGRRSLVPFLEAAMTGFAISGEDDVADDVVISGAGVTIGGGVQYFVRRNLSLNAGVRLTNGALTQVEVDGDSEDIEDQHFTSSRVILGATWHP
jgi:opacity protein-like surface antigen